jgi:small-conductance mechanosensitive channel
MILSMPMRALAALLLTLCLWAAPAAAQDPWFETGPLNPGLGPAPETLDRSTPMATIENFLFLTDRGNYSEAAHLLDLGDLPQADQGALGPDRAYKLSVLLERKAVVPWSSLADRPDGWLSGSTDSDETGRERRSILIDRLEMGSHAVPIRLNRIKPEDGDPVWVISRQSVDNIPTLFDLYGPTRLENALPPWALAEGLWGMYVWETLFVPLLLLGALVAGFAVFRLLRAIAAQAPRQWMRIAARSLKWPVTLSVTAAIVGIGTRDVLVVSGVVDVVLGPVLLIVQVVAATMALVLAADQIFDRVSAKAPNELADPENSHLRAIATTVSAVRKFVIVIAVLVATGVVLSSIDTHQLLGFSLLASAGALTIVLGFAAREVLGNILASVQIALNRSARIGDQLIFEGHFCTVERIHFTYVQLLVWNGNRLIVPVSTFVKDPFENWSIENPEMVRPIELVLAQSADVEKLREFFLARLKDYDDTDVGPMEQARVLVTEQDAFGLTARFELPSRNPATGWDIECEMREALLAEAARIEQDTGRPVLPPPPRDMPEG